MLTEWTTLYITVSTQSWLAFTAADVLLFPKRYVCSLHTHSLIFVAPLDWNTQVCSSCHMENRFMSAQLTVVFNVYSEWALVRMNLLRFDSTNSHLGTNNLSSLINSEFRIYGLLHVENPWTISTWTNCAYFMRRGAVVQISLSPSWFKFWVLIMCLL